MGAALEVMLRRFPHVEWIITTLGDQGSVMIQRCGQRRRTEEIFTQSSIDSLLEMSMTESFTKNSSRGFQNLVTDGLSTQTNSMRYIIEAGDVCMSPVFEVSVREEPTNDSAKNQMSDFNELVRMIYASCAKIQLSGDGTACVDTQALDSECSQTCDDSQSTAENAIIDSTGMDSI